MGKTETLIPIIVFNVFFILFIVGIIIFIKQYKQKKKEHTIVLLNQKELHQKEMFATQIEIQSQTMQHIGREIHDNIGQKLTLASLYTQQLAFENKAPLINEKIESISIIINESLSELRQLSKSLTDDSINSFNINDLIEKECSIINALKNCKVHFITNAKNLELSYQIKVVLYRITQEFIQNSIKYAACQNIYIELKKTANFIELVLNDDGKGFDKNIKNSLGIGLKNMKKRAKIINAEFNLTSTIKGTTVTLKIPFTDEKSYRYS